MQCEGEARTLATPVKGTSLPSFLMMKEGARRSSSNAVPNLTTSKSLSPMFLTVATILSSDADATLSVGVERTTSRSLTARTAGVA